MEVPGTLEHRAEHVWCDAVKKTVVRACKPHHELRQTEMPLTLEDFELGRCALLGADAYRRRCQTGKSQVGHHVYLWSAESFQRHAPDGQMSRKAALAAWNHSCS